MVDRAVDCRVVGCNAPVAQKLDLPLDGACGVADAEAQNAVAFAGVAMLVSFGLALPAKAGAMQVAEIELPWRVVGLGLPVLNLHAFRGRPDARLAVTAKTALFGHQCLPQCVFSLVVIVVGVRRLAVLGQAGRLGALLDRSHLLVAAFQEMN